MHKLGHMIYYCTVKSLHVTSQLFKPQTRLLKLNFYYYQTKCQILSTNEASGENKKIEVPIHLCYEQPGVQATEAAFGL